MLPLSPETAHHIATKPQTAATIDLWLVHYREINDINLLESLQQLLSAEEQQRGARFLHAEDRHRECARKRAFCKSLLHRTPLPFLVMDRRPGGRGCELSAMAPAYRQMHGIPTRLPCGWNARMVALPFQVAHAAQQHHVLGVTASRNGMTHRTMFF